MPEWQLPDVPFHLQPCGPIAPGKGEGGGGGGVGMVFVRIRAEVGCKEELTAENVELDAQQQIQQG